MANSSFRGFSDMLTNENHSFSFQCPINSFYDHLDEFAILEASFGENRDHIHAHVGVFDYQRQVMQPSPNTTKHIKTSTLNSSITSDHSLMNQDLSQQDNLMIGEEEMTVLSNISNGFSSPFQSGYKNNSDFNQDYHDGVKNNPKVSSAQDHILAERKRREKLSYFLKQLVFQLKKMDKASVPGDAIKELKIPQNKMKALEERIKK